MTTPCGFGTLTRSTASTELSDCPSSRITDERLLKNIKLLAVHLVTYETVRWLSSFGECKFELGNLLLFRFGSFYTFEERTVYFFSCKVPPKCHFSIVFICINNDVIDLNAGRRYNRWQPDYTGTRVT
jgi:hypothetical protein